MPGWWVVPPLLIMLTFARTYGISTITTEAESKIDQPSRITAPDQNGDGGGRVPKVISVFDTSLLVAKDWGIEESELGRITKQ